MSSSLMREPPFRLFLWSIDASRQQKLYVLHLLPLFPPTQLDRWLAYFRRHHMQRENIQSVARERRAYLHNLFLSTCPS
jgi:hypothetical protein